MLTSFAVKTTQSRKKKIKLNLKKHSKVLVLRGEGYCTAGWGSVTQMPGYAHVGTAHVQLGLCHSHDKGKNHPSIISVQVFISQMNGCFP